MEAIIEKKLANSLHIKVTDHSRLVAADRWFVKIVCEVKLSLIDEYFSACREEDQDLFAAILHRLGREVSMELVQERNFIDAEAREEISRELLARISANINSYLSAESFPRRFFAIRYQEARKACLADRARGVVTPEEDDAGPADFSACFRD